jgi:hypothetical protein
VLSCGLGITRYIIGLNDELLLRQRLYFRFEDLVELLDELSEFLGLLHIYLGNMHTGKKKFITHSGFIYLSANFCVFL